MEQRIIKNYKDLDDYFISRRVTKILLICGKSFEMLEIRQYFKNLKYKLGVEIIYFNDFKPNPQYESVVKGIELYRSSKCDGIVAVGGGSAMDVAKCIKIYAEMNPSKLYLLQKIIPNTIPFCAIPTTAGTGSESTRFAVIYYNGEKQSINEESCMPEIIYFDSTVLKTLPEYQRKVTMLDALCHCVESCWSVNSTYESQKCALEAIRQIIKYKESYLKNNSIGNERMLVAANLAGKAINITQTTAGHALCYKLTTKYGIAHGHAAALCVSVLWPYMLHNLKECVDPRGEEHLEKVFQQLAYAMGGVTLEEGAGKFKQILNEMEFDEINESDNDTYHMLVNGVNLDRLQNNPVVLTAESINMLYHEILDK